MAFAEGRTGHFLRSDGAPGEIRLGRFGELHTEQINGKYFELARRGLIFHGALQAGTALGTALTATAVTFTLYNPVGSGVNLSVLQTAVVLTTQQVTTATVETIVYAGITNPSLAAPATVTALTNVYPAMLGAPVSPMAKVYTAATLPATPVVVRWFPSAAFNQVTTQLALPNLGAIDYVDGALVLSQGTSVTIQGIATTTGVSGAVSMVWAEIPV